MLWVQTRRWVPASSSRATRGAPQKSPMMPGTTTTRMPSQVRSVLSFPRNAVEADEQGNFNVFGTQYAMRIWLDTDKLNGLQLTPVDVKTGIKSHKGLVHRRHAVRN